MTVRDICEYIAICDYFDFRVFFSSFGMSATPNVGYLVRQQRNIKHRMYVLAFDMIMRGEY